MAISLNPIIAFFSDEKNWSQRAIVRGPDGLPCVHRPHISPQGYCMLGAIGKMLDEAPEHIMDPGPERRWRSRARILRALADTVPEGFERHISVFVNRAGDLRDEQKVYDFNDDPTTTHADMMAWLRRADALMRTSDYR